jgi:hypothetical protein
VVAHYRFFRAYDLEDACVITLTGVLLFVVLFYTYPLKFVSIVVALVCGRVAPNLVGIAGYVCCTIGLVEWRVGEYRGRGRKRLMTP